jgi:hypothetical protein
MDRRSQAYQLEPSLRNLADLEANRRYCLMYEASGPGLVFGYH